MSEILIQAADGSMQPVGWVDELPTKEAPKRTLTTEGTWSMTGTFTFTDEFWRRACPAWAHLCDAVPGLREEFERQKEARR